MRPIEGDHVWELRFQNTIAGSVHWGEIPPGWSLRLFGTILPEPISMEPNSSIEVPEAVGGFTLFVEAIRAEQPSLEPVPLIDLIERLFRGETNIDELIRRVPTWYNDTNK
jgi:hypothetical protein